MDFNLAVILSATATVLISVLIVGFVVLASDKEGVVR